MLVSDILHSCAHEGVAEAAVASIGGSFASHLRADAEERGVSVGFLAAGIVRSFARHASERDWRDLVEAVRGQDFPVLHGLQVVLTKVAARERPTELGDSADFRLAVDAVPRHVPFPGVTLSGFRADR